MGGKDGRGQNSPKPCFLVSIDVIWSFDDESLPQTDPVVLRCMLKEPAPLGLGPNWDQSPEMAFLSHRNFLYLNILSECLLLNNVV